MGRGCGCIALSQVRLDDALHQAGQIDSGPEHSRGRQWAAHQPGRHGRADSRRCSRHHRRRASFDRGPVLADQDFRGPLGGHPRVHRLQHLRLQVPAGRADHVHAERDRRRGIPPRLASGEIHAGDAALQRARRRRRPGGHGVCASPRRAGLRRAPARSREGSRRPLEVDRHPAPVERMEPRDHLPADSTRQTQEERRGASRRSAT